MKKCTSLEEAKGEKVKGIFRDTFILAFFAREIKDFYQSSLKNKVYFRDITNVSPNILANNQNLKKQSYDFVDERVLITTPLIPFCHWKTLAPLCLRKERPEKAFLTLIVNYRQIALKKKFCHPKL